MDGRQKSQESFLSYSTVCRRQYRLFPFQVSESVANFQFKTQKELVGALDIQLGISRPRSASRAVQPKPGARFPGTARRESRGREGQNPGR